MLFVGNPVPYVRGIKYVNPAMITPMTENTTRKYGMLGVRTSQRLKGVVRGRWGYGSPPRKSSSVVESSTL